MGLYRTKPEEVEAVQFLGTQVTDGVYFSNGTSGPLPAWLWDAIARGDDNGGISFSDRIPYLDNGDTEVMDGDWIVRGSDGVLRTCDEDDFKRIYTPARKRLYGDAVETEQTETAEEGKI